MKLASKGKELSIGAGVGAILLWLLFILRATAGI